MMDEWEIIATAERDLADYAAMCDVEEAHMLADKALIALLRRLGYDRIADLWDKVKKWYG